MLLLSPASAPCRTAFDPSALPLTSELNPRVCSLLLSSAIPGGSFLLLGPSPPLPPPFGMTDENSLDFCGRVGGGEFALVPGVSADGPWWDELPPPWFFFPSSACFVCSALGRSTTSTSRDFFASALSAGHVKNLQFIAIFASGREFGSLMNSCCTRSKAASAKCLTCGGESSAFVKAFCIDFLVAFGSLIASFMSAAVIFVLPTGKVPYISM
mmetsp:Transcript_68934/g.121871  ORF Transcript_68934/g.121871 Transcript_68934/m.121871 type:complete len:213 (-) Transcript_68934:683-1321(-)